MLYQRLGARDAAIQCVALALAPSHNHHRGTLAALGTADGTVWLWDADSSSPAVALRGHRGVVRGVGFSSSGNGTDAEQIHVVSAAEDGTVRVWDASPGGGGKCLRTIADAHEGPVLALAVLPGERAASGGHDGAARVWDVRGSGGSEGQEPDRGLLRGYRGTSSKVFAVAATADGKYLASGTADGQVVVRAIADEDVDENEDRVRGEESVLAAATRGADGWVRGRRGERVMWLPPAARRGLAVGCEMLVGARAMRVDIRDEAIGSGWARCWLGEREGESGVEASEGGEGVV